MRKIMLSAVVATVAALSFAAPSQAGGLSIGFGFGNGWGHGHGHGWGNSSRRFASANKIAPHAGCPKR